LLLSQGLERDGCRARAVASGPQALKVLRDELFDCVPLDVLMPELDGYQVLELIRSDPSPERPAAGDPPFEVSVAHSSYP
jgi:CheY-like chemotaxis protein